MTDSTTELWFDLDCMIASSNFFHSWLTILMCLIKYVIYFVSSFLPQFTYILIFHWHFGCSQGDGMTSIEPTGTINDICVFSDSGLMLLALDGSQIPSYFIPALGPAPKWCSYLENLTVWFQDVIDSCSWNSVSSSFQLGSLFYWLVYLLGFVFTGRAGGGCTNNHIWWFQISDKGGPWEVEFDKFDWY